MIAPRSEHDVNRPLSILRAAAIAVTAFAVALRHPWPEGTSEQAGWIVVAVAGAGSLILWGWGRGSRSETDVRRIEALGFALDVATVLGITWAFLDYPFIIAALPLAPLSGALRYRWTGAAIGTASVAIFGIVALLRLSSTPATTGGAYELASEGFDLAAYALIVGVSGVVGCLAALFAHSWHTRRLEFENQAARLVELDNLKD